MVTKFILQPMAVILLMLMCVYPSHSQTHWCCEPDDCDKPFHPPCEVDCMWTQIVHCQDPITHITREFAMICYGTGINYTIYFTPEGHNGCIAAGLNLVECTTLPNMSRCINGPPPGWLCLDFMSYLVSTC